MNIEYENIYSHTREECPIEDFVAGGCYDNDSSGVAETAQGTAENTAKVLGRLIEFLAAKGLLSGEEIGLIVGNYMAEAPFTLRE